jgi:hypothetical protein
MRGQTRGALRNKSLRAAEAGRGVVQNRVKSAQVLSRHLGTDSKQLCIFQTVPKVSFILIIVFSSRLAFGKFPQVLIIHRVFVCKLELECFISGAALLQNSHANHDSTTYLRPTAVDMKCHEFVAQFSRSFPFGKWDSWSRAGQLEMN